MNLDREGWGIVLACYLLLFLALGLTRSSLLVLCFAENSLPRFCHAPNKHGVPKCCAARAAAVIPAPLGCATRTDQLLQARRGAGSALDSV